MKTFDDAVDSIFVELTRSLESWEGNHCRCVEIAASEKLNYHCQQYISMIFHSCNPRTLSSDLHYIAVDKDKIVDSIVDAIKLSIELGVAIGQEMEKE